MIVVVIFVIATLLYLFPSRVFLGLLTHLGAAMKIALFYPHTFAFFSASYFVAFSAYNYFSAILFPVDGVLANERMAVYADGFHGLRFFVVRWRAAQALPLWAGFSQTGTPLECLILGLLL